MNINHTLQIDNLAHRPPQAVRVAKQFEEIFVRMMVQSFRESSLGGEGGMFGQSVGSGTYEQWFDQHMSSHLSQNSNIGIAETLIRDFRRLGELGKAEEKPCCMSC